MRIECIYAANGVEKAKKGKKGAVPQQQDDAITALETKYLAITSNVCNGGGQAQQQEKEKE